MKVSNLLVPCLERERLGERDKEIERLRTRIQQGFGWAKT